MNIMSKPEPSCSVPNSANRLRSTVMIVTDIAIDGSTDRGGSKVWTNRQAAQPLRHVQKHKSQTHRSPHSNIVWTRLAVLGVSAMVAFPAYEFISGMLDSRMLGVMAASLLLIPLLNLMSCMLDPCAQ